MIHENIRSFKISMHNALLACKGLMPIAISPMILSSWGCEKGGPWEFLNFRSMRDLKSLQYLGIAKANLPSLRKAPKCMGTAIERHQGVVTENDFIQINVKSE
jgi:hypothetical protein